MITKKELIELLSKKYNDLRYDEEKDILYYSGKQIDFDKIYKEFLKKNGMSFKCICDIHWECMSILECTECGTVIKYYYDEFYEPNFKCPVCTNYETGYEYHTREEIENSKELQAIINMYRDYDRLQKKQEERINKRNGLLDYQLSKPIYLKTKKGTYRLQLLINSSLNKNKLQGLRLEIVKFEKSEDGTFNSKWFKEIPLSINSIQYHNYKKKLEKNPELDPFKELEGKPLSQIMEEAAVRRLKK